MFLLYLIKDFKALGVAAKARGIDKDCKKKNQNLVLEIKASKINKEVKDVKEVGLCWPAAWKLLGNNDKEGEMCSISH